MNINIMKRLAIFLLIISLLGSFYCINCFSVKIYEDSYYKSYIKYSSQDTESIHLSYTYMNGHRQPCIIIQQIIYYDCMYGVYDWRSNFIETTYRHKERHKFRCSIKIIEDDDNWELCDNWLRQQEKTYYDDGNYYYLQVCRDNGFFDLNNDEKVNAIDELELKSFLVGKNYNGKDLDEDGKINSKDAIFLSQFICGNINYNPNIVLENYNDLEIKILSIPERVECNPSCGDDCWSLGDFIEKWQIIIKSES